MRLLLALALPFSLALSTACAATDDAPEPTPAGAAPNASEGTAATSAASSPLVTCGGGDFELCVTPVEEQRKLSGPASFREGGTVMISLDHHNGDHCVSGSVGPDDASKLRIASAAPGTLALEGRYCLDRPGPAEEHTDDCVRTAGALTVSYRGGVAAGRNVVRLGDQELAFDVPSAPVTGGVCVRFRLP